MTDVTAKKISVLIPCRNEEVTVERVISDFRAALPSAAIYVYDNNSTDRTVELARAAGAIVCTEPEQGKGNAVRRMFADVEADIYVIADGDATYNAASAPEMVAMLAEHNLDMIVAARTDADTGTDDAGTYRPGHQFGNWLFTRTVGKLFGEKFTDMLSGYRVLSRRYVKSFPAISAGFEIETELTIHALDLRLPVAEIEAPYAARPTGSESKLSTWKDGLRILGAVLFLFKEVRPFKFFGAIFAALALLSLILAAPVVATFIETGQVPRQPTAVLSTGIMLLAFISLISGIILDSVSRGRREAKRLRYLALPPPGELG